MSGGPEPFVAGAAAGRDSQRQSDENGGEDRESGEPQVPPGQCERDPPALPEKIQQTGRLRFRIHLDVLQAELPEEFAGDVGRSAMGALVVGIHGIVEDRDASAFNSLLNHVRLHRLGAGDEVRLLAVPER